MLIMRRLFLCATVLVAATSLSACSGYRPLYGGGKAESAVAGKLAAIHVSEVKTRAGQLVRNELVSVMRGSAGDGLILELLPEETSKKISEPVGQKLERFRYTLKVKYALHRAGSTTADAEGTAFSNVSYDTVEEPVADLQAAENARVRAAKEVASDIRLRIAARLSQD